MTIGTQIINKVTDATAEMVMNKVTEFPKFIKDKLSSQCKIEGHELTVSCTEGIQHNMMAISVDHKLINPNLKIDTGHNKIPSRLKLISLYGEDCSDAIKITDNGFILKTGDIAGNGIYSLRFDYPIDTKQFIDAFVDIRRAKEAPRGDNIEYWMHAELKCPQVFKTRYSRVEFQDIDFTVNVGVSSDIKNIIPKSFENELNDSIALLTEKNPHEITKRARKLSYSKRERGNKTDVMSVLNSLQKLFESNKFSKFIQVEQDFKYSECHRGVDSYSNLPYPTWPLSMSVVSQTDLDLNKCAADGTVIYKKNDFINEVNKIIKK